MLILIFAVCYCSKDSKTFITQLVHTNTPIRIHYTISNNTLINVNDGDIIVHNREMFDKIVSKGQLGFAESYMDGDWDSNNLEKTLYELLKNYDKFTNSIKSNYIGFYVFGFKSYLKKIIQYNTLTSSKNNIARHYNIGNDLYIKMLDKRMQYTCAYFHKPNMSLDEAQLAKMELIAKKLDLKPGMKILDIGCGFGTMGYHLSSKYNVKVVGVTLSTKQKEYADKYLSHSNLEIQLKDYRNATGKYDRIYSVGMFEHVGRKNYYEYYNKCYQLLKNDGIMLIHTIGANYRHHDNNTFITKYIFPEGELPHFSNLTEKFVDKWHLEDVQNFGLSYAKTLEAWKKNIGNWEDLSSYDTRFRRMWNFYLSGCAASFRERSICLWQLVYTKRYNNRTDDLHHIRICN